jgi:hypothetical protein
LQQCCGLWLFDCLALLTLQGEVEQISLMDPQQLLSYLSEIIGTHEYEERLETLAKTCASAKMSYNHSLSGNAHKPCDIFIGRTAAGSAVHTLLTAHGGGPMT